MSIDYSKLPERVIDMLDWTWDEFAPFYQELAQRPLTADSLNQWMVDWSAVMDRVDEVFSRLHVAHTVDTTDEDAERAYNDFLEHIVPPARQAAQELKERFLASGLEPENFAAPLRNMKAEAEVFRSENLPLFTDERKLSSEYDKIVGAQTVEWEGRELTIRQLLPMAQDSDRTRREEAWRLSAQRQLADREAINALWRRFMNLRRTLAANAQCGDYRDFCWRQLLRFDYTPADCETFHAAIEQVVVPAASRIYEKRRRQLDLDSLRPWDLAVDPLHREPLRPFADVSELDAKCETIFHRVAPRLGEYFATMRSEGLLDLPNRKGKAPGGYCATFAHTGHPFIFMNAVGIHDDVQTMLHEAGHAFHVFESNHLPLSQQKEGPMEFAEVASMSMELLAGPYLSAEFGGFYDPAEAARARIEHLEKDLLFWPYMAVVDAFQHWVYTHHDAATDAAACDAKWGELWDRFMPGVDYDGFEDVKVTGWHRKLHIHRYPFYYVEYGLAQLGAVLVWRNSLADQENAIAAYRKALSLGGTASLPELFAAAGARFAFDANTLQEAVDLMTGTIEELEQS
ncbi:MAG: M3 family oligoendopeptidase [Candidatus Lernaella stagnicola]|nr:M3 family oligoendopeptidase [Candidatus Lernaella stagnicola]